VKNLYTVLGVKQDDNDDTIKKAYRKLAKKYHPDNDSSEQAKEKMIAVSEAWEVLGNKTKREKYDKDLLGKQRGFDKPFKPAANEPGRPMTQEDFFNMTRGFDNMLSPEAIKAAATAKKNQKQTTVDINAMFEKMMGIRK